METKETEGEVPQNGEVSRAVSEAGVTGVFLPCGVADIMHTVFDSPVPTNMGVDGGGGGTTSPQAGNDEGVFFRESVSFKVEFLSADYGYRPCEREADVLGGRGPDGPPLDASV